jgi:hypothetical protein
MRFDCRCNYCGVAVLADKFSMEQARGWDWYTGLTPPTRHICPNCNAMPERHRQFQAFVEQTRAQVRGARDQRMSPLVGRDEEIRTLRQQGLTLLQIAKRFSVTKQAVSQAILKMQRTKGGEDA